MAELIVLLPTKNEESGLAEVIERIPIKSLRLMGYETRVVVVDGFSTDATCEIANSKGVELINQTGESGKGNGVRQALDYIFPEADDSDLMIMLDADATYSPEDIVRFVESLENNDVVWGSRLRGKIEHGAMSRTNRLGNIILSLFASIVYFKRTTDLCTGYWGFKMDALKKTSLTADGFNLEANIFASVCKEKFKSEEIVINYAHREGDSNLKWYYDGPRIFSMILKKRFSRK